ncbi:MAG: hypothetical protein Q9176_007420 [Flavoplaca citrina]
MDRQPSLNDLNDDVLLEIIATVKHLSSVEERKERFYANQQSLSQEMSQGQDGTASPLSDISRSQLVGPLMALSMTSRRFRNLTAPTIYRSVNMSPYEYWWTALGKLDSIADCEAARVYTRCFRLSITNGPPPVQDGRKGAVRGGPEPPDRFAPSLHGILSILSNLKELTLVIPQPHSEILKTTFEASNHSFESVRTLILGIHTDWIIAKCPNVQVISVCDRSWMRSNVTRKHEDQISTNLVKAAGPAKYLRHFEMYNDWSRTRLDAVYQGMPQIHVLAMPGRMPYEAGLEALLPVLRRFTDLKVLALADLTRLDVGFHPPRCGNVYRGPNGHLVRERVEREMEEAKTRAAGMVFANILKLEELWIEDCSRATVVSTKFGNEIHWTDMPRPRPYKKRWDLWED